MTVRERSGSRPTTSLGPGAEFDLIRAFLEDGAPGPDVRVGPGDDALVLEDGLVLTTDLQVEDVHFRRAWLSFRELGRRAATAALSDLAAMAAEPVGVLVSLAVARAEAEDAGRALHRGVRDAVESVGGFLLGGDLSSSPGPLVVDVVAVGRSEAPVLRSGARAGDELWVTGRLGGAAAAVASWRRGTTPSRAARAAFVEASPRIREALWLAREGGLRALIDLSDGLAGDAGHLSAASGVAVVLDADAVPALRDPGDDGPEAARARALRGGEDYELLMAAAPGAIEPLAQDFELRFGVPLTRVGEVAEGEGVRIRTAEGVRTLGTGEGGFDHFGPDDADEGRGGGGGR